MRRRLRERLRHKVVATLKSGSSFIGVLYAVDSEALVLRDARLVEVGQDPVSVDGEVLIMRVDLDYLQLP